MLLNTIGGTIVIIMCVTVMGMILISVVKDKR